jgi:hypothetical protein
MLRTRANVLSACDSDPKFIEVVMQHAVFFCNFPTIYSQELYKQSAALASSIPLQQSAFMSLQSLRVSLGQYAEAPSDAQKLRE